MTREEFLKTLKSNFSEKERIEDFLVSATDFDENNIKLLEDNDIHISKASQLIVLQMDNEELKRNIARADELGFIDAYKQNPRNAVKVQGDITPGQPVDLKISLDDFDLKFSQLAQITSADVTVTDNNTREIEKVKFVKQGDNLIASVPTVAAKTSFNYDVLLLVAIFGLSMFLTQKIMMATNKMQQVDPAQEAMQKSLGTMMPVMLTASFLFIPIPAGVFLYLITSNIIQIGQTLIINKQLDIEAENKKNKKVLDSNESLPATKKVEAKEIKNTETDK